MLRVRFVASLLVSWLPAQAPQAPAAARFPALRELDSWRQTVDARAAAPVPRGAFLLGNGAMFGCLGLAADGAATVQRLCGPDYSSMGGVDGDFGAQSFALAVAGQPRPLPLQSVARVRGAAVVVTEDRSPDGLVLATVSFVPPDAAALYRLVSVHNGTGKALEAVELRALLPAAAGTSAGDALVVRRDDLPRPRSLTARLASAPPTEPRSGRVVGNALALDCGALAAGATAQAVLVLHAAAAPPPVALPTQADAERHLEATLQWWRERLAGTTTAASEPPRFADLFESGKVLLLTQRSATNGLFAPMVGRRECLVHELSGSLLACLRYRLWTDAARLLTTLADAAAATGRLPEALALDAVFPAAPADAAWGQVEVPAGGLGSLFVLWHEWYFRASGDLTLARRYRPLLERCLTGQGFTTDGLQAFGAAQPTAALAEVLDGSASTLAHAPWAGRSSLSLTANALHVLAWMALGELETALDRPQAEGPAPATGATAARIAPAALQRAIEVGQHTERMFWREATSRFAPALSPLGRVPHDEPLADENLRLQWLGYTFAAQDRNRRNLRGTLAGLWRAPDAVRVGATAHAGWATGETQSLLVQALADLDDQRRDGAVAELLRLAAPAGGLASRYDAAGQPAPLRDGLPEHAHPGASGLAIDALCFAVTGIRQATVPGWDNGRQARFQPRLPPATTRLEFRDLQRDGRHLHLRMELVQAPLDAEALALQESLLREGKLDPAAAKAKDQPYPRLRYAVECVNPPPDDQHVVCAVDVGATTLVRYLAERLPSFGDDVDPPVDPQDHWPAVGAKLPAAGGAPTPDPAPADDGDTLLLTARADTASRYEGLRVRLVDAGLPWSPEQLAARLVGSQASRLCVDVGVLEGGAATGKSPAYWQQPALREALQAFATTPRTLVLPQFVDAFALVRPDGKAADRILTTPHGVATIPAAATAARQTVTVAAELEVPAPVRGMLRVGAARGITVRLGGQVVLAQPGFGTTAADQAAAPVELAPGVHRLECELATDPGAPATFCVRLCGRDGLPLPGLVVRRP